MLLLRAYLLVLIWSNLTPYWAAAPDRSKRMPKTPIEPVYETHLPLRSVRFLQVKRHIQGNEIINLPGYFSMQIFDQRMKRCKNHLMLRHFQRKIQPSVCKWKGWDKGCYVVQPGVYCWNSHQIIKEHTCGRSLNSCNNVSEALIVPPGESTLTTTHFTLLSSLIRFNWGATFCTVLPSIDPLILRRAIFSDTASALRLSKPSYKSKKNIWWCK